MELRNAPAAIARPVAHDATRQIDLGFSLYLDLVRLFAALIVFLAHAQISGLGRAAPYLPELAPVAVVVFFVLSGYIIEATTDRAKGWRRYAVHRLARIYSVVLPALLLSMIAGAAVARLSGTDVVRTVLSEWGPWWRLPSILSFQAEDWLGAVEAPWNGPLWSLHYEVLYYVLYGLVVFLKDPIRPMAVLVASLVAGPKILLLLPCWWVGAEIARRPGLRWRSRRLAWAVFLAAPFTVLILTVFGISGKFQYYLLKLVPLAGRLDHSLPFITHYITAGLVAVAFVAARQLHVELSAILKPLRPAIVWAAGYTFSIYLLHRPLQHVAERLYQANAGTRWMSFAVQAAIMAVVIAIGTITERRTASWRRFFTAIVGTRTAKPV